MSSDRTLTIPTGVVLTVTGVRSTTARLQRRTRPERL